MSVPNFTGNFRHGRQINLARGSAASHRSSHSVLKDASAARAKREEVRKRDKAAVKIQSFVRGRREVAQTRLQMRELFIECATEQRPIDPNEAVSMFLFFYGKCGSLDQDVKLVATLEEMLGSDATRLRPNLAGKLAKLMLSCVEATASSALTESYLRLLSSVQANVDLSVILEAYSSLISHLSDADTITKVVDNVFLAIHTSLSAIECDRSRVLRLYIEHILSTPKLFVSLAGSERSTRLEQTFDFRHEIIQTLASTTFVSLASVRSVAEGSFDSDMRLTWLLANVLYIWKNRSGSAPSLTYAIQIMQAVSNLLLSISSLGVTKLAKALTSRSKPESSFDPFILSSIEFLEERVVLDMAISPFRQSLDVTLDDYFSTCRFFVGLGRIWPGKTSKIRYFLYLNPEHTLPLFFKIIKSSTAFNVIVAANDLAAPGQPLWSPVTAIDEVHDRKIQEWEILSLFLDICWHWMIMTDDDEFFDDKQYGLSQDDVRLLGSFLKMLVFLIICNSDPSTSLQRGRSLKLANGNDNDVPLYHTSTLTLNTIKHDAVGIMRQLYYRDARRHFLGEDYWLLMDKMDVMTFSQLAVADAEKARQYQDLNSDAGDDAQESSSSEDEDGDKKMTSASAAARYLRRRMMTSPRLELLQKIPFVLSFALRVDVLDESLEMDRHRSGLDRDYELRVRRYTAEIRRGHMLEDAFAQLNHLRGELKSLIGITFYNEFGVEAGIDGGGITKEFLSGVVLEGFDPSRGLFLANSEHMLYPNPQATSPEQLQKLEFLGRIIGKAVYQGILVEVIFAQFFLSKWQQVQGNSQFGSGFRNTFDDLWSLDAELYKGLINLKNFKGDVESVFGLNFTIVNANSQTVELIKNGANVAVTNANRLQYIHAVADYKLNKELYLQTMAFLSGMNDLLSPSWLMMFGAHEMQTLVGGAALPIDIDDWKRNTLLGGFLQNDDTIKYFWEVINELDDAYVFPFLFFFIFIEASALVDRH